MSETDDSEEEWRFSVDEFDDPDEADDPEGEERVEPVRREIEPQEVRAENALFVVLGVALTVGVIAYGIGLI
jgi:hypothetical protein